jgi:hypothetical protein
MKNILLSLILAVTIIAVPALAVQPAFAADPTQSAKQEACAAVNSEAGGSCTADNTLGKVIAHIINIVSVIGGVAAVIMIMIAGLKFITSSGDAQSVSSAKKTLIYAIVGLVVIGLAQAIVHFVLKSI